MRYRITITTSPEPVICENVQGVEVSEVGTVLIVNFENGHTRFFSMFNIVTWEEIEAQNIFPQADR